MQELNVKQLFSENKIETKQQCILVRTGQGSGQGRGLEHGPGWGRGRRGEGISKEPSRMITKHLLHFYPFNKRDL